MEERIIQAYKAGKISGAEAIRQAYAAVKLREEVITPAEGMKRPDETEDWNELIKHNPKKASAIVFRIQKEGFNRA